METDLSSPFYRFAEWLDTEEFRKEIATVDPNNKMLLQSLQWMRILCSKVGRNVLTGDGMNNGGDIGTSAGSTGVRPDRSDEAQGSPLA